MNLLREMIRKLILENKINPNKVMLQSMMSSDSFRTLQYTEPTMSAPFTDAIFEWGDDPCLYEMSLQCHYDDVIFVAEIQAAHDMGEEYSDMCEGQGHASNMMRDLMDFADKHDVQLSLVADAFNQLDDDDRRPDTAALTAWYKRLGFEDSPQSNGTLVYNYSN